MTGQLELPLWPRGETSKAQRSDEAPRTTHDPRRSGASGLMEAVLDRDNLKAALKRVKRNGGSPGIDGMSVLQVLQPQFDPTFSDHSYGFRPGRRAHDAVRRAQRYIEEGRRWVVDVDLEKFFDRVHHDTLMGVLSKRITDRRVLRLGGG
jgi:retron-type reverse transcriptase